MVTTRDRQFFMRPPFFKDEFHIVSPWKLATYWGIIIVDWGYHAISFVFRMYWELFVGVWMPWSRVGLFTQLAHWGTIIPPFKTEIRMASMVGFWRMVGWPICHALWDKYDLDVVSYWLVGKMFFRFILFDSDLRNCIWSLPKPRICHKTVGWKWGNFVWAAPLANDDCRVA